MLFKIIAILMITVSICLILKKTNPEISMLISIVASIVIFSILATNFTPIFNQIHHYANKFNLNNIYINTMLKVLGICYLTQIASQTCIDAGYGSMANKIEIAGKLTIVMLAIPMFTALMETIEKLINLK